MNKTVVRCLLSRSHHPLIHFSTKSSLLHRVSTSSRYLTTRFMSTPPPDEMYGFDDPFSPSESWEVVDLTEEYSFLQDSLLDSAAHIDVHQVPITQSSDDARAIADAVSGGDVVFGSKSQKFLRQFREKLSESLVIEVLRLIERPSAVISFFVWAGRQIGYKHTAPVYIALEDLGRLKDFRLRPSGVTYNCLIQAFLKADRLDSASLVHREMSLANLRMDGFTLRCFAYSLCKVGKWREALTLMETENFVPDTVFYTKLISGLCEASLFEEAMDFLNRMRATSCLPNVVTYSTLLCGCLNKKQLGRCKRVLNMMMMEGC